ncbi:ATP-dependent DNA helicase RecG [Erysipelothrix aquatica]|uniref:ATP-dependent DNA helicase RecG n=1 Tax=Erysipelothrix aquatica TaxID=2683714 RepID=UPI00135ABC76|nr:ATP-dependent DNA helicase RecG [Erysipelothrix aquatica]
MKLTDKQNRIIETFDYSSPEQFLNHYPYRYDSYETKSIDEWVVGETVVFEGKLASGFRTVRFKGNQSVTNFQVFSNDTLIKVSIFNRPFLRDYHYKEGIVVIGTVQSDHKVMAKTVTNKPLEETLGLKPSYPLKAGIKNYEVERLIKKILESIRIEETVPAIYKDTYRLQSKQQALQWIHRPQTKEQLMAALRTLKYEEFLRYHLSVALNQSGFSFGIAKAISNDVLTSYLNQLPYDLTKSQNDALSEILNDIRSDQQMHRLLQGDVGSGKTVVAFLSAISAIKAGYQVVFMVPTEILMNQHLASFKSLFPDISVVGLSQNTEERKNCLERIMAGSVSFVIGTHAVLTEDVIFNNLGYVIIDEQHRFGVRQRQTLIDKGTMVDVLMMSATPIPRTLANSLYFDLSVSTISGYPSHRKLTETFVIKENSLRTILDDLNHVLDEGEQIYVVCAAIEEGERPNVKNVHDIYKNLSQVFKGRHVGMLHGKMTSFEKDTVMAAFNAGHIDILVTTTVIEVGVDVHNANTMVIYNAEQFGLATLHQLRGRVGRGRIQGRCFLLSSSDTDIAEARLNALASSHDGFELSMMDMRMRGIGDALGFRQSGVPNFILGDIEKDEKILYQAKIDAKHISEDKENPEYKAIINSVLSQDYFKTT